MTMARHKKAVRDEYSQWRSSLPSLPDHPQRLSMGSGDHLNPVLFSREVEKVPARTGPDSPVHRNPTEWYGLDGSEV
jgi:hypothetical protein